nr:hypothetical protein [Microbacterium bovistercoris]
MPPDVIPPYLAIPAIVILWSVLLLLWRRDRAARRAGDRSRRHAVMVMIEPRTCWHEWDNRAGCWYHTCTRPVEHTGPCLCTTCGEAQR